MIVDEEKRDLEEHWRLLYVALTRAADRLIVSGVAPKAKKDGSDPRPANCWHRDRRAGDGRARRRAVASGHVALRYGSSIAAAQARPRTKSAARRRSPFRTGRSDRRRPKRARRGRSRRRRSRPTTKARRRRARRCAPRRCAAPGSTSCSSGLPAVEPTTAPAAARSLARALGGRRRRRRPRGDRRAGLRHPRPTRASRRCSGRARSARRRSPRRLPDGRVIAGTVDRLLVEDERVSVIDFKTGQGAGERCRHPECAPARRWTPMPRRCGSSSRAGEVSASLLVHRRPETDRSHALRGAAASAHMPVNF